MKVDVGKRLKDYTATAINTGGEVYKRIIANEEEKLENQAAIEEQLNILFDFLEHYREPDIFEHEGIHGLKSINFFSGLRKVPTESLIEFRVKYKAMMLRREKGLDYVWGTKHNIEHALSYFFGNENVFVMNYTNQMKTNLLSDQFTTDRYTVNGKDVKNALTEEAALVNIKAIRLKENQLLQTEVYLEPGVYSFHFFMRGMHYKSDGYRDGEVLVTVNDIYKKNHTCDDKWKNVQEYIEIKTAGNYTFSFASVKSVDLDFFCLFPKVPYPSMSILVGNGGLIGRNFMFFAPGTQDVEVDADGVVTRYNEPPFRDTHTKYKFWFPNADDTEAEAKKERKDKKLSFDDRHWGYWSDEMRWVDVEYINLLLDVLIPVGVKVFELVFSRRG